MTDTHRNADLAQLRAVSHPTRIRIMNIMAAPGSTLTVGDIAARTGESAGTISYHLRQLAKAGLVEQIPSPDGDARKSCWRATTPKLVVHSDRHTDPASAETLAQSVSVTVNEARMRYRQAESSLPEQWRHSLDGMAITRLTVEEAEQMQQELMAVANKWVNTVGDRHTEGDGSEQVMVALSAFRYLD
ncbi:ArsR family transcriptional regulator [Bifidobacterium ramosum]|uniref:ArsR family transcriptional regulator n=1 Tax=Bifidobacterium ramosum TaxID=1798158 RepID=A0A6L4X2W1_9BIFI|nr:winged helix-turn-helix domain-containing protein [Bifidobacterium ramosum]KAB8288721.1 ArsR family transcriptional regulator [Bifidobacterium ramosum]NEG71415.1 helix-turn-helix domain-containing protein [Bifidobacterium ramosum]